MFGFLQVQEGVAVRHRNGTLTYPQLHATLGRLLRFLQDRDLRPGDRVAMVLPNSLELLAAYYACLLGGFVAVPVTERLTLKEIDTILRHSRPRCVLTSPSRVSDLAEVAGDAEVVPLDGIHTWLEDDGPDPGPLPQPSWPRHHPAVLFYTSGSTGTPKGVLYTHRTLIDNCRVYQKGMEITADDHSVLCHCMATNFVFAQLTVPVLDLGGTVEVVDFGSADQTLKAIDGGATFLSLIPWFGYQLIEAGRRRPPSPNRLRACAMGGDRIPLGFFDEFREVFGILPREHLGMAETNVYVVNPPEEDRIKVGSVGLPMPDAEVEVRGPQGERLPIGAEGEIWVKALTLMEGYWEDPDLTEAVLVDGWFGTGDLGHFDEDGYLWFSGRAKHLIVCDGDNIHPREIEHEIARHPLVEQACVVGVPEMRRGETVGVALTLRSRDFDLGLEELASYLEHRLTEVKIPKSLVVLEALPETVAGKVDRRAVLSLLQGTAKG